MSSNTVRNRTNEENKKKGQSAPRKYSREELFSFSKSLASVKRPAYLERVYNGEDGKWDPDRWYKAKFGPSREDSLVTFGSGKDRRRGGGDLDRDVRRRPSNDPVEHVKEERDGIVLSPQWRSFGTGNRVQTFSSSYTRQLAVPADRDGGRAGDWDRDGDRCGRKVGSGRMQRERENSQDYSRVREHDRDRGRNSDFSRQKERGRVKEPNRQRATDLRDSDKDRERDRDRRVHRSDRFHHGAAGDKEFTDRNQRDRDFRARRQTNHRDEEKPEWFTGGATSKTDFIELGGFERGGDKAAAAARRSDVDVKKLSRKTDSKSPVVPSTEVKPSKETTEESTQAAVPVPQPVSSVDNQAKGGEPAQEVPRPKQSQPEDAVGVSETAVAAVATPQHNHRASSSNSNRLFDIEEILSAILPVNEAGVPHGSRFSQFFTGPGRPMPGNNTGSVRERFISCEDGQSGSTSPSPVALLGLMGAMHPLHPGLSHLASHHNQEPDKWPPTYAIPHHRLLCTPGSSGDNNAGAISKAEEPLPETSLLNSPEPGGHNSSISSNSSFSTQDAEVQLKNMLFCGSKDSPSSSDAASPASFLPGIQRKVKTVSELEADMRHNSSQKMGSGSEDICSPDNGRRGMAAFHRLSESDDICSPDNGSGGLAMFNRMSKREEDVCVPPDNSGGGGGMGAFNRLLIMINAASEAKQNVPLAEPQVPQARCRLFPGHSEFNKAVMRNREEQMQLLHQSLKNLHQPVLTQSTMASHVFHRPSHPPPQQQPTQQPNTFQHQHQQRQQQQQAVSDSVPSLAADVMKMAPNSPGLPQAMSTPNMSSNPFKPRVQDGVPADPILSFIRQNPGFVVNPPAASLMAAMLAFQQSAGSHTSRASSPQHFNQQHPLSHMNASSPVHPGQQSPGSLAAGGANLAAASGLSSPLAGMGSPVYPRVLSQQELSAHAQAVMQGALIKKQLQEQNERYLKKQQEKSGSPNQHQVCTEHPQAGTDYVQPVVPPNQQPKGVTLSMFTPTSVLRKMHSDKVLEEKEKKLEGEKEELTEETDLKASTVKMCTEGVDDDKQMAGQFMNGVTQNSEAQVSSGGGGGVVSCEQPVSDGCDEAAAAGDTEQGSDEAAVACPTLSCFESVNQSGLLLQAESPLPQTGCLSQTRALIQTEPLAQMGPHAQSGPLPNTCLVPHTGPIVQAGPLPEIGPPSQLSLPAHNDPHTLSIAQPEPLTQHGPFLQPEPLTQHGPFLQSGPLTHHCPFLQSGPLAQPPTGSIPQLGPQTHMGRIAQLEHGSLTHSGPFLPTQPNSQPGCLSKHQLGPYPQPWSLTQPGLYTPSGSLTQPGMFTQPGSLAQPTPHSQQLSIEEKMKLSALTERQGYMSQIVSRSTVAAALAEAARPGLGRPIVRALEPGEERNLQQHGTATPVVAQVSKYLAGIGPHSLVAGSGSLMAESCAAQQGMAMKYMSGGRAIMGSGVAAQQLPQMSVPPPALNVGLQHQHLQQFQQLPHCPGALLPPSSLTCVPPPPGILKRAPLSSQQAAAAAVIQQHLALANPVSVDHFMAVKHAHQHHQNLASFPTQHVAMRRGAATHNQATGPLSAAALNAAIQRISSPHGSFKFNDQLYRASSSVNGGIGPKVELSSGIQHWFCPDILETQLPRM